MNVIKKHGIFILIGLLIGLAMGGSLVFWKHAVLKNLVFNNRVVKYVNSFFDSTINEDEDSLKTTSNKKLVTKNLPKHAKPKNNKDTTALNYEDSFMLSMNDSINAEDTLLYADFSYDASTTHTDLNRDGSEIVVMRDKLISSKQIMAKSSQNSQNQKKENLDSLLIGGKQTKTSQNEFTVEFWESPINYKGYKRNKNKVLLYGINQFENISLYRQNNSLYIKYNNTYYILENNSFFQNFIPVDNPQLISQLEQL